RARGGVGLGAGGGAGGPGAGAALGDVADACRWPAHRGARLEGVGGAGVAHAVAGLGDIARAGGGAACEAVRTLRVGRAVRSGTGAVLGEVAGAGRGPADGGAGDESVGRAVVVHTIAVLGHVTDTGRRTALRRALRIGRTRAARAGAGLRQVAHAGRRAAHLAAAAELTRRGAARGRCPVEAAALIALLATRALYDAVAAQRDQRDGDEVSVVGLGAIAHTRIVASGLPAVGDRQPEADGALVATGEEAVGAAAARAPGEADRVRHRRAIAAARDGCGRRAVERDVPRRDRTARISQAERSGEGPTRLRTGHRGRVCRAWSVAIVDDRERTVQAGGDVEIVGARR